MDADTVIRDYLARLDAAADGLPPQRRAELIDEVREHIEVALTDVGSRDEVAARNVLDRLGSPDEIVAAERAGAADGGVGGAAAGTVAAGAAQAAVSPGGQSLGAVEIIALLFLTIGAILIPFLGPILGLLFVWLSDRWSGAEKTVATVIVMVLLALPFALFFGMSSGAEVGAPQTVPAATAGP